MHKINKFWYKLIQFASWVLATFVFKRKVIHNEIKNVKGPFVVIANHECAIDFVNLIGLSRRSMYFVISNSFYSTLPFKKIFDKVRVIPKQQFQTTTANLKRIKGVVDGGSPLVIYPAGLMCEDGLSTPIPLGTYKFLKWLGVDVYVARTTGAYFVMPKWSKGLNPGKTFMDVTKLFDKDDLKKMEIEEIKKKTRKALLFDAYREQDELRVTFKRKGDITGLDKVLYMCPSCEKEFTIRVKDRNKIFCEACGFEAESDEYYMLRSQNSAKELKYVSDWSKMIQKKVEENLLKGIDTVLEDETEIHMINRDEHKFELVGEGRVRLDRDSITLEGQVSGKDIRVELKTTVYPTLPFKPGKCFELQDGETIYRLMLKDGSKVIKYIDTIKAYFRIEHGISDEL